MVPEANTLQSVKRLHGAVDLAALTFIIKESTGEHPTQQKTMTYSLPTDQESYTELQELCQECGVTLGGAETITELIEILEPLIGDIF